jgi:CspA family cold shock protein
MPSEGKVAVCQRCGSGFIITDTHRDLLLRRQAHVIVPVLCPTCFVRHGPQPKRHGEVKWFNPGKRYGFIVDETGEEIFFHQEQLLAAKSSNLPGGQRVRYHVRYRAKGPEALNVELAG